MKHCACANLRCEPSPQQGCRGCVWSVWSVWRMMAGDVSYGEEGDKDGGGHKRMAAAVTHLLSSQRPAELSSQRSAAERAVRGGERSAAHRKRRLQQSKGDSESEDGSVSDEERDNASTAGDVVSGCHRLPDVSTLGYERRLQKIATTGVVQLFNAVSKHSREVQAKMKAAGTSERKKAKVLSTIDKGSFIDLLKGQRSEVKRWPALKEDFMLGAKMRDWREGEGEGEGGGGGEGEIEKNKKEEVVSDSESDKS